MRPIDADKVNPDDIAVLSNLTPTDFKNAVKSLIHGQSTIDLVHAAGACHCWECKYYREFRTKSRKQIMRLCYRMGKHDMECSVKPDDFCSYGKLKEE